MRKPAASTSIGDDIRVFIREMTELAAASRVHSVIGTIVANTADHLLLRARESDRLQDRKKKEAGDG